MTDPVPLSALPVGSFFDLVSEPGRVWRIVYPPLPNAVPDLVVYGIAYQPTNDGNSVYAVDQTTGELFRMQSGMMARPLKCVRVVRDLT